MLKCSGWEETVYLVMFRLNDTISVHGNEIAIAGEGASALLEETIPKGII